LILECAHCEDIDDLDTDALDAGRVVFPLANCGVFMLLLLAWRAGIRNPDVAGLCRDFFVRLANGRHNGIERELPVRRHDLQVLHIL
jgi:hypothetical protein